MRVLGVGHCTLDYIGVIDRFAEPDFKVELDQLSVQGGGSAATALVALARWGQRCEFIGKVGADERGQQILATLTGEGITVDRVVVEPHAASQVSFIMVSPKLRQKQTYFTHGTVTSLRDDEVDEAALDQVSALLVDGSCPKAQRKLMSAARRRGIRTVLDTTSSSQKIADLIEFTDIVIGSERALSQITGMGDPEQMCHSLHARGVQIAVVTLGDEGCVAMSAQDERPLSIPAHEVNVLDTTGAGDVFHGAFIQGLLMELPLHKVAYMANMAAAISCAGIGGRSSIPSLQELLDALPEG
jgi:sugar/nucleoside kinase (ribokinase family)